MIQQISLDKILQNSNKFSLAQATSNSSTGKTSGSGTIGVFWGFIIGISFIFGVYDKIWGSKTPDIMLYTLTFASICAGLLGYRKGQDAKGELHPVVSDDDCKDNNQNS